MEYKVIANTFDIIKYKSIIAQIEREEVNLYKEKHFLIIAKDILEQEGYENIQIGLSDYTSQSVPFDILAQKDGVLSLIELKGTKNNFNFSKEIQFSRFYQVVEMLKEKDVKCNTLLLQIILDYGIYQIFGNDFYEFIFYRINKDKGKAIKNIKDIVEGIMKYEAQV